MAAQLFAAGGIASLQLISGYYAAKSVRESAALNKDIADLNAEFAELDAYDAEIDGFSEQARYQAIVDKTLGEQTAILAAQDVDLTFGTVGEIQKETRFIAEINKMEIQKQANERALGFKNEARSLRVGGFLERLNADVKASQIKFQSVLGAAQTSVSGYRNFIR